MLKTKQMICSKYPLFFAQPDVMKIHARTITVNYNTGYKITLQEQNTSGSARETTAFAITKTLWIFFANSHPDKAHCSHSSCFEVQLKIRCREALSHNEKMNNYKQIKLFACINEGGKRTCVPWNRRSPGSGLAVRKLTLAPKLFDLLSHRK